MEIFFKKEELNETNFCFDKFEKWSTNNAQCAFGFFCFDADFRSDIRCVFQCFDEVLLGQIK